MIEASIRLRQGRHRPGIPKIWRWVICYGLATLLILAAIDRIKYSLASRYSDRAEAAMLYWAINADTMRPRSVDIGYLRKLLERSLSLDSDNPNQLDRLSQLDLWELTTQEVDETRRQQLHTEGLEAARRGVALRPGWALAWARLLVWKSEFNELDLEFHSALERATTLGQWQRNIHPTVLQAVLPVWDSLDDKARRITMQTGRRGLIQDPEATLELLKEYDRLADVCALIPGEDPLNATYCAKPPLSAGPIPVENTGRRGPDHPCSSPASAMATARNTARPLFRVSSHSLRGRESCTIPAPA